MTTHQPRSSARRSRGARLRPIGGLGLALALLVAPPLVGVPELPEPGERMLGIFLMAIVLWITEAIPLHATAVLVILLQILLVSDRALLSLPNDFDPPSYASFFETLAHPVLMLFLGGFFLADGAARYRLDRSMARVLLRPFGRSPRRIVLGLMLITAVFSMFMSNTATTATLMALVLPVIGGLDRDDRLRVALALAIPIAANVGGLGTPVGTPPNAIAVGLLADAGINVSFLDWMAMAVPPMVILLLVAWLLLMRLFPPSRDEIELPFDATFDTSWPALVFYVTFAATVGLWLTEPLHGISSSVVGFLPVVVLLATGVFTARDLQSIQWHVLWLVAGGIALGLGVAGTGLDTWIVGLVNWSSVPASLIVVSLAAAALLLSTVISNTAAANLIIPLGLSLAGSGVVAVDPVRAAFFTAVGASLAMSLPVSTPPNAIAYSTGVVRTIDLAITGIVIGLVGLVLYLVAAPWVWSLLGWGKMAGAAAA